MKKYFCLLLSIPIILSLSACNNNNDSTDDLSGTWKQINSNDDDNWMEASIEDDSISVDWIMDDGETRSIYWVGTYESPEDVVTEYDWTSERDVEATEFALLAAQSDEKVFTYENGELIF